MSIHSLQIQQNSVVFAVQVHENGPLESNQKAIYFSSTEWLSGDFNAY